MAFPPRLVLASHNRGKIGEFERLLSAFDVELQTAVGLGLQAPDETQQSYRGNARLKALASLAASGWPALADDTGLEIDAMGGRPGVSTAGFAQRHGGWLHALEAIADRTGLRLRLAPIRATAVCALVLARSSTSIVEVEYQVRGRLTWPPDLAAPGFAALFRPEGSASFWDAGVLLHRRRAFARLAAHT